MSGINFWIFFRKLLIKCCNIQNLWNFQCAKIKIQIVISKTIFWLFFNVHNVVSYSWSCPIQKYGQKIKVNWQQVCVYVRVSQSFLCWKIYEFFDKFIFLCTDLYFLCDYFFFFYICLSLIFLPSPGFSNRDLSW